MSQPKSNATKSTQSAQSTLSMSALLARDPFQVVNRMEELFRALKFDNDTLESARYLQDIEFIQCTVSDRMLKTMRLMSQFAQNAQKPSETLFDHHVRERMKTKFRDNEAIGAAFLEDFVLPQHEVNLFDQENMPSKEDLWKVSVVNYDRMVVRVAIMEEISSIVRDLHAEKNVQAEMGRSYSFLVNRLRIARGMLFETAALIGGEALEQARDMALGRFEQTSRVARIMMDEKMPGSYLGKIDDHLIESVKEGWKEEKDSTRKACRP